ncbi:MAG: rhomboid family intramembrane serine protease [Pseudomonadota bacterium]
MIPLRDDNPAHKPPIFTLLLIAGCVATFLWQLSLGNALPRAIYEFGFVPLAIFADVQTEIPVAATIVTSMFLHGGALHLAGNMLYLWVFGDNIEDAFGHIKFLLFYFACGIVAALTQAAVDLNSNIPMIGASGAVSGVLGAYIVHYPGVRVLVFIPIFFFRLPAVLVLGVWFLSQLANSVVADDGPGVAFAAHVGGFVAGVVFAVLLRK